MKDLIWQFADRGNDHRGKWLSTGGLSALDVAFKALVWDDPYYVEGAAANIPVARPGLHAAPRRRPGINAFAVSIFSNVSAVHAWSGIALNQRRSSSVVVISKIMQTRLWNEA